LSSGIQINLIIVLILFKVLYSRGRFVTVRTGNERNLWPVRGVLFKFFSKCHNCIGRRDSSLHVGICFVLVERKLYQSVWQCTGAL